MKETPGLPETPPAPERPCSLEKIVSGGQSGVDRAALDAALDAGLPCGGWCPRGRKAEDGVIAARYPLRETPSTSYAQRTKWNVRDSDGTLVLAVGAPTGGTLLTVKLAASHSKPCRVLDLEGKVDLDDLRAWLEREEIRVLNVAGPRESTCPGVRLRSRAVLVSLFDP